MVPQNEPVISRFLKYIRGERRFCMNDHFLQSFCSFIYIVLVFEQIQNIESQKITILQRLPWKPLRLHATTRLNHIRITLLTCILGIKILFRGIGLYTEMFT